MIERKNEERGNFLTFYDRGIKTCLKKKDVFFHYSAISKHSLGLFELEFQHIILNIFKKVESKLKKFQKLMSW